jgi:HSP20 family protein
MGLKPIITIMTLVKFKPGFSLRDSMMPSSFSKAFDSFMDEAFAGSPVNFTPALDVIEDDKSFTYSLALPGLKKEDIKIDLKNDLLTISGERKFEKKENGKVHRVESYFGTFTRSFTLPENIKADGINAEFINGILNVVVQKGDIAAPKTIEVK